MSQENVSNSMTNNDLYPCHGCALTKGAAANCEPHSSLKAELSVLGGVPFFCHEKIQGWEQQPVLTKEIIRSQKITVCRGWKREVNKLADMGYYKVKREDTKLFAMAALIALNQFLSPDADVLEKAKARQILQMCIIEFGEHRRKVVAAYKESRQANVI